MPWSPLFPPRRPPGAPLPTPAPVADILLRSRLSRPPRAAAYPVAAFATALLFAASVVYWLDLWHAQAFWPASGAGIFERGEWYRAPLSALAHADPRHVISNAFLFFVFALLLWGYFGALAFPIVPVLLAPAISAFTVRFYDPQTTLIGASGVVNAMVGEWLALYWLTARHLRPRTRTLRALGFATAVLVPGTVDPEVSNLAHAIGFLLGLPAGALAFFALKSGIRADEEWGPPPFDEDEIRYAALNAEAEEAGRQAVASGFDENRVDSPSGSTRNE